MPNNNYIMHISIPMLDHTFSLHISPHTPHCYMSMVNIFNPSPSIILINEKKDIKQLKLDFITLEIIDPIILS